MIKKNVYFKEINLENTSFNEFKIKLGDALEILYPHTASKDYENMNADAFLDWVCDLWWIEEDTVIVKINGPVSKEVEDIMNIIVNFWKHEADKVIEGGRNKDFEFIINK